jgi:hypothetical protein
LTAGRLVVISIARDDEGGCTLRSVWATTSDHRRTDIAHGSDHIELQRRLRDLARALCRQDAAAKTTKRSRGSPLSGSRPGKIDLERA